MLERITISRVALFLAHIRSTYWFVPGAMSLFAALFAIGTIILDQRWTWTKQFGFFALSTPEGARTFLSVISGSLITVATVAFSMTLLAISHVSSRYGPRIFSNLMKDRGNQICLGMFTATFIYSLMIMQTVRSKLGPTGDEFVPHVSLSISFGLSLACIGTLIYFFHHVPETMRLSTVLKKLGTEFKDRIRSLYPDCIDEPFAEPIDAEMYQGTSQYRRHEFVRVRAGSDGYLQSIDLEHLVTLAQRENLEIVVKKDVGEFLYSRSVVLEYAPQMYRETALEREMQNLWVIGQQRTPVQDFLYSGEQLVEIAVKSLSPGVNEPVVAIQSLNWICSGLLELSGRRLVPTTLRDDEGTLRVIAAEKAGFSKSLQVLFDVLLPHLISEPSAAHHGIKVLDDMAELVHVPEDRSEILIYRQRLLDSLERESWSTSGSGQVHLQC